MPSLWAILGLKTTAYEEGLARAKLKTHQFAEEAGATIKGKLFGAFAAGALVDRAFSNFFKVFERAKSIHDQALQAGISEQKVQELGKAAGRVGLEFEDVQRALDKLLEARREAVQQGEGGKLAKEFELFGISLEKVNDAGTETVSILEQIISKARGGLSERERAAFRDFFGRQGGRFAAMGETIGTTHATLDQGDVGIIHRFEQHVTQTRNEFFDRFFLKPIAALLRWKVGPEAAKAIEDIKPAPGEQLFEPTLDHPTRRGKEKMDLMLTSPQLAGAFSSQNPAFDELREQTDLLRDIAENTKATHEAISDKLNSLGPFQDGTLQSW